MLTLFGKMLKQIQQEHGITHSQMARDLSYSKAGLFSIENGFTNVPDAIYANLQAAYNLSEEQLEALRDAARHSVASIHIDLKRATCEDRAITVDIVDQVTQMDFNGRKQLANKMEASFQCQKQ